MSEKNSIAKAMWTLLNRGLSSRPGMADGGLPTLQYRGPDGKIADAATEDELGRLYNASGELIGHNPKFKNEAYGAWHNPEDQSALGYAGMKAYDVGEGAYNAAANLLGAISPVGSSEQGNMALQVPPMIPAIGGAFQRLIGTPEYYSPGERPENRGGRTPSPVPLEHHPAVPGKLFNMSRIPELDKPIQDDVTTGLLSFFGGNAFNPLAAVPKGSLAAGAVRAAEPPTYVPRLGPSGELAIPESVAQLMQEAGQRGVAGTMREETAAPIRGYHGTKGDIEGFDLGRGSGSGSREGPLGVWSSDNPDAASSFADFASRGNYEPGSVLPLDMDFKNPLVLDNYNQVRDIVDAHTKFERPDYEVGGRQVRMSGDVPDYAAARQALIDQGYDGIIVQNTLTDSLDGNILVDWRNAIKPNTVRSATTGETLFSDNKPSILGAAVAGTEHLQPLDMSHAARMKRAEEMGFDTSTPYYHGTDKAGFHEFDTSGEGKTRDTGAWFTDSLSQAKTYTKGRGQLFERPDHKQIYDDAKKSGDIEEVDDGFYIYGPGGRNFYSTMDEFKSAVDDGEFNERGSGVYPVYLKKFDPKTMAEIDRKGANWDGTKDGSPQHYDPNDPDADYYDTISTDEVARELIRDAEEKGVLFKNSYDAGPYGYGGDGNVRVVPEAKDIRHVDADFDPRLKDKANIFYSDNKPSIMGSALATASERPANMTPFYGADVGPKGRIADPAAAAEGLGLKSGLAGAPTEGFFNPATSALLQSGVHPKNTVAYYQKQMGSRGGKLPPGQWEKATEGLRPDDVIARDDLVKRIDALAPITDRRKWLSDDGAADLPSARQHSSDGESGFDEPQHQGWSTDGPFQNYTETAVG
jgi:hypothetical protein